MNIFSVKKGTIKCPGYCKNYADYKIYINSYDNIYICKDCLKTIVMCVKENNLISEEEER